MIGVTVLYLSGVPFLLALSGWFLAKSKRILASVLLLSLTIWPAYHLWSGNSVGTQEHLVFGYLFAYPLVGLALATIWERQKRKAVVFVTIVGLVALGYVQLDQFNRRWPDLREAAGYLVGQVQPGQKLLINESWPCILYLYTEGRIHSPWDVLDVYRMPQGQSETDLCRYDWFVNTEGANKWPESVLERIKQCGDFEPVFSTTSTVVSLLADLHFSAYPVRTTIWRNTSTEASR
jgi:hypothetical protein